MHWVGVFVEYAVAWALPIIVKDRLRILSILEWSDREQYCWRRGGGVWKVCQYDSIVLVEWVF